MGLGEGPGKARFVRGMFTRIAERYDLMNALMTFGMHHSWRRAAARETIASPEGPGLDLATGTGDLAFELCEIHRHRLIVGADFAHGMLQVAEAKGREVESAGRLSLLEADALELPFWRIVLSVPIPILAGALGRIVYVRLHPKEETE